MKSYRLAVSLIALSIFCVLTFSCTKRNKTLSSQVKPSKAKEKQDKHTEESDISKVRHWKYGEGSDTTLWYDVSPYFKSFDKRVKYKPEKVPLQGSVFYPHGKGPFPLVLLIHGNFIDPLIHSEEGYEYIAKDLAEQGFIVASLGMNFLNGNVKREMGARSMVVLEHLKLFRKWNETAGTPLYRLIDLNKIGLAGHSRGGEAAAGAAFLNIKLNDKKRSEFNLGFKIRSIFTLAPTEGQFPVSDGSAGLIPNGVEYFMMLGSRDTGTDSYRSLEFFSKLFSSPKHNRKGTKSMLWIYGANHSNWNSAWHRYFSKKSLKQVLPAKTQQEIAKKYIAAFFMMTLYEKEKYRSIFKGESIYENISSDIKVMYQYQDAERLVLHSFEGENGLYKGTLKGVKCINPLRLLDIYDIRNFRYAENYNSYHLSESTNGLVAGWKNTLSAQYIIRLPKGVDIRKFPFLAFKVGQIYSDEKERNIANTEQNFSIRIKCDSKTKSLKASDYGSIPYPDAFTYKKRVMTKSILQTIRIPVKDFISSPEEGEITAITEIIFDFNIKQSGLLAFDDIQFSK